MDDVLKGAQHHRTVLRIAIDELEAAMALPAMRGEWVPTVRKRLVQLRAALKDHVEEVDRPDGLFAQINEAAPQLADKIAGLRREHGDLEAQLSTMEASLDEPHDDPVETIREVGLLLMGRFIRHRQHGADLVFAAYDVDIGGGD